MAQSLPKSSQVNNKLIIVYFTNFYNVDKRKTYKNDQVNDSVHDKQLRLEWRSNTSRTQPTHATNPKNEICIHLLRSLCPSQITVFECFRVFLSDALSTTFLKHPLCKTILICYSRPEIVRAHTMPCTPSITYNTLQLTTCKTVLA